MWWSAQDMGAAGSPAVVGDAAKGGLGIAAGFLDWCRREKTGMTALRVPALGIPGAHCCSVKPGREEALMAALSRWGRRLAVVGRVLGRERVCGLLQHGAVAAEVQPIALADGHPDQPP